MPEEEPPPPPGQAPSGQASWYSEEEQQQQSNPPPQYGRQQEPAAASSTQQYTPINYQFRSADAPDPRKEREERSRRRGPEEDGIPLTASSSMTGVPKGGSTDDTPKFANPRQDAVGRFMSTARGQLALRTSSTVVGGALGGFLGKSTLGTPTSVGIGVGFLFLLLTFLRNPYGELSKALGLTLIMVWQRFYRIRRRYPTWPHVKACLGMSRRRAFPRNDDYAADPDVNFVYTLVAMGFVGSTCGGNLPLVPTWMGALGGAALFCGASTLKSARGDLARSMGMRVVGVMEELLDINGELKVVRKSGVVAGLLLDKVLIMDRKHKIKDRIVAGVTSVYDRVSNTASEASGSGSERDRDDRSRKDDRRRGDDNNDRRRGGDDDSRPSRRDREPERDKDRKEEKRGFFGKRKQKDDDDRGRDRRGRDDRGDDRRDEDRRSERGQDDDRRKDRVHFDDRRPDERRRRRGGDDDREMSDRGERNDRKPFDDDDDGPSRGFGDKDDATTSGKNDDADDWRRR